MKQLLATAWLRGPGSRLARILTTALLINACSNEGAASPRISNTGLTLEQVLFLPDRDIRYRFDVREWGVCRTSDIVDGVRLGIIPLILNGSDDLLRLADSNECNVLFAKEKVAHSAPSDLVIEGPGCTFVFSRKGEQLNGVSVQPLPFLAPQYEKCFFRIGLFLQGFNGTLVIPDEDLFVPIQYSVWGSFPHPPQFAPLFQYLMSGCDVDLSLIDRRSDVPREMRCVSF